MKIAEIENWVKKKGLEPKHLILEKNQVKWLVCVWNTDGKQRLVVYDKEGRAYISNKEEKFSEEFFERMALWKKEIFVVANLFMCKPYERMNYNREGNERSR